MWVLLVQMESHSDPFERMRLAKRGKAVCTCVIIGIYGPVYFGFRRTSGLSDFPPCSRRRWRREGRGEMEREGRDGEGRGEMERGGEGRTTC